jgi:hypothetical protein
MVETVIFLVLAGLALIFRWFTIATTRERDEKQPPLPNERAARRPAESEEERVRRFLEALGMPQGSSPPPPVRPRPATPRRIITPKTAETRRRPRRSFVQPLPPLVTTPAEESPPQRETSPEPPALPVLTAPLPSTFVVETTVAPTVVAAGQSAQPLPLQGSPLGVLLRDRRNLRQAIILREVLGPPRAFASLSADRGFPEGT